MNSQLGMAWHGKAPMAPYTILQRQRTIYDWRDPKLAVRFKSTPAYARACPTSSHLQPHTPLESLNFGSGSAPAYPRTGRRLASVPSDSSSQLVFHATQSAVPAVVGTTRTTN
ncbi:hypothetical protein FRC18_007144 [Serendipita sp. 400]|nr:hypothetical protein FRC18_007144 [Serendipita sp. 400]